MHPLVTFWMDRRWLEGTYLPIPPRGDSTCQVGGLHKPETEEARCRTGLNRVYVDSKASVNGSRVVSFFLYHSPCSFFYRGNIIAVTAFPEDNKILSKLLEKEHSWY
jgi:hypothetical protein